MKVIAGVVFFTLLTQPFLIFGSELMTTADVLDTGGWRLSVYGRAVETEPVLEVTSADNIQVPTTSGNSTIFSKTNAEIEMEAEYDVAIAALMFRPRDGLEYKIKLGQIRDYEISFASGNLTNAFRAQSEGILWGVGGRWRIKPGSIVSSAMSIDFNYTRAVINLDRFQSGTLVAATDQRIEQDEYQVSLNISRRWKRLEPFGGLKLNRTVTQLKDRVNKQKIRGTEEGVSPFIGLSVDVFERESFIVEVSFVDEEALSAGFNITF